jgi:hypothetical protein
MKHPKRYDKVFKQTIIVVLCQEKGQPEST